MAEKDLFANFKPGQPITCTVTANPRTERQQDTLQRLMRNDPAAKRGLRKSQRLRRQNMIVYNRGNRDWYKRMPCSKIVQATKGQTWSMKFTFDLVPEFTSLKNIVSIKPA